MRKSYKNTEDWGNSVALGQMQLALIAGKHLLAMREEWYALTDAADAKDTGSGKDGDIVSYMGDFGPESVTLACAGDVFGAVMLLDDMAQFVPVKQEDVAEDTK